MNPNQAPFNQSPTHLRNKLNGRPRSNVSTPTRRRPSNANDAQDSGRSDRTADMLSFNNRMDLKADLEELQNQLQLTQMQNRHLQSQLDRATPVRDMWTDDSPSTRRVQKLEQANSRLHDMLDDSAKKVSHYWDPWNMEQKYSAETREKISRSKRERPQTLEHRAKVSEALKGRPKKPFSEEHRANLKLARLDYFKRRSALHTKAAGSLVATSD